MGCRVDGTAQADGQVAEGGHHLRRVAGMDATGVFGEVHIAHPVQAVFDAPVTTMDDQLMKSAVL